MWACEGTPGTSPLTQTTAGPRCSPERMRKRLRGAPTSCRQKLCKLKWLHLFCFDGAREIASQQTALQWGLPAAHQNRRGTGSRPESGLEERGKGPPLLSREAAETGKHRRVLGQGREMSLICFLPGLPEDRANDQLSPAGGGRLGATAKPGQCLEGSVSLSAGGWRASDSSRASPGGTVGSGGRWASGRPPLQLLVRGMQG